jgi:O-antigen ligase
MIWHVHILGLERDIEPNGFLATIPHTSLAIILGLLAAISLSGTAYGMVQKRVLPALILCAALSVPLLSQTRSGLLLALTMGVLVWLLLPNRNIKLLACMGGVAIGIMIVSTNSPLWTRHDKTLEEIEQYSTADHVALTSATIRIVLWKSAGRMFVEHPMIGVGNHRFRANLSNYKALGKVPADLDPFSHPHDEFLKFAAEGGLLGILSLALLYFVPLGAAWRSYRLKPSAANPALLVIVVSCGFLVAGLVDVVLAWRNTIMFYGLVTSLLLMEMDRGNRAGSA